MRTKRELNIILDSVLYGASSVVVLLSLVARIYSLRYHGKPHHLGRTAWIYWPSQAAMSLAATVILIEASFLVGDTAIGVPALLGCLLMSGAWVNTPI